MGSRSRRATAQLPQMESLESRLLLSAWYVRPWNGTAYVYGTGGGDSYANAWNGFLNIVWGSSGVKAGDDLYVCGTHPNPANAVAIAGLALDIRDTQLDVKASGASESARITIRGDYAGDPGQIVRVKYEFYFDKSNPSGSGWTGPDAYGAYRRAAIGTTSPALELDRVTNVVHKLTVATATPSAAPSQWTGGGIICTISGSTYYKPRVGATQTLVYANNLGRAVNIRNDKDYITVQNLGIFGCTTERGAVYISNGCDHLVLDGLRVEYNAWTAIKIDRMDASDVDGAGLACNFGEIKNCYANQFKDAVYFVSGTYKHSDWWIHDNVFENGYQDGRYGATGIDYHGICLEGGSNHVVENNVIRHVGTTGILVDLKEGTWPTDSEVSNVTIRNNWIEDVHSAVDTYNQFGIAVSTTVANHVPDHSLNDQVYNNVIIGAAKRGISAMACGEPSSPTLGKAWTFANNLLADNYASLYFKDGDTTGHAWYGGFDFYNDIVMDSDYLHMQHIYNSTTLPSADLKINYTLYDPNPASPGGLFKWSNVLYDFAGWKIASGKDQNSPAPGDPRFVNEAARNYRLAWNSPAIDAGFQWWSAGEIKAYGGAPIDMSDFDGNPIYGTPDIGPFEYQPPYRMGIDALAATSGVRLYGDGKYRNLSAPSGATALLSVAPAVGWGSFTATEIRPFWMDLAVSTWQTSGDYVRQWTETSDALGAAAIAHIVGGLAPNTNYNVSVNGVWGSGLSGSAVAGGVVRSDASGQITFTYSGEYSSETFALSQALWGDFTGDGVVDAEDIDRLMAEVRTAGNRGPFDLTLDGAVSQSDMDNLIHVVLGTEYGDMDLNGLVDQADYTLWYNNYGVGGGWARGDVNGDGLVDQLDYTIWYNNYGFAGGASSGASTDSFAQAVSQPVSSLVVLAGAAVGQDLASEAVRQTAMSTEEAVVAPTVPATVPVAKVTGPVAAAPASQPVARFRALAWRPAMGEVASTGPTVDLLHLPGLAPMLM